VLGFGLVYCDVNSWCPVPRHPAAARCSVAATRHKQFDDRFASNAPSAKCLAPGQAPALAGQCCYLGLLVLHQQPATRFVPRPLCLYVE
jgi:hypothetical protein